MKNLMLPAMIVGVILLGCSNKGDLPVDNLKVQNSTSGTRIAKLSDLLLGHKTSVTLDGSDAIHIVDVALHHPDSTHSVSGGDITINGVVIPRWNIAGGTWYQNKGGSWQGPLVLDGSYHVFNIPGGPGFPAFVDSVRSPNGATTITFPTISDTLSRSAGATIQWTPTGGVDGVKIMVLDTAMTIGSKMIEKDVPGTNGSLQLSSAELSQLKPGPIRVRVYRGNSKTGIAGPEQKYRVTVFSSQGVRAWLKD